MAGPLRQRNSGPFEVIAQNGKPYQRPRPGAVWRFGALRLRLPVFPELTYWFPPQVIAALATIAEAAHGCQESHLERVALVSLSACIIAKWAQTLSYAMDIDHTRPHRRVQRLTLDRVLTTYLKRLDRTLACLGMLHEVYRDAGVLNTLQDYSRVISPHDAREPLSLIPDQSQALVITSPLFQRRRLPARTPSVLMLDERLCPDNPGEPATLCRTAPCRPV
ncbi:MAG TPA: hypothetical protein VLK82_24850 [Candidatus Tectomicrobia bacterium]|nr:hypothetical protein [Candidatus Tectomicrobia bacterium]